MKSVSRSSSWIILLVSVLAPLSALAKGQPPPNQAQAEAQQQAARKAQEEEFKAQQDQARRAQENQAKVLEETRRNQEQALKAQEESARNAQMAAVKSQQQEAMKAQERAQQQQAKMQEDQVRNQQRVQENTQREAAKAQENAQREAAKAQENQVRAAAEAGKEQARISTVGGAGAGFGGKNRAVETAAGIRPFTPRALPGQSVPLNKALSMPVLAEGANAQQQEHAQQVQQNLQAHLMAFPLNQGPTNINAIRNASINNYFNNYRGNWNNQAYEINRANTFVNQLPPNDYPYWYHPEPNWVFANSFVFGNNMNCGLDWLRWGWHPYYGPPPEGFVCAADYIPTPWIYIPAYGVWRQPGLMGYAESGPPYDYTGPISVEVLEPRHVSVRDPYTGYMDARVVNVVYMYNAFYYPEEERWGYMNRHGYFLFLNL